jgi:hypothetical protein
VRRCAIGRPPAHHGGGFSEKASIPIRRVTIFFAIATDFQLSLTHGRTYADGPNRREPQATKTSNSTGDQKMTSEIRVDQLASRPLAVVRRLASQSEFSKVIPEACGLVWKTLRAHQVAGAGRNVALYLDTQFNLEIGVEMDQPFTSTGEVIASATHHGPYQTLGQTHDAVQKWCARQGHALAGPSWEVYGHWKDEWIADASQIRTDVFYLLNPVEKFR